MNDSIAILGRQPMLGLAELESLYGGGNIQTIEDGIVRLSVMPCAIDYARLGGTVKLCKILTTLNTTSWKDIEQFLMNVSPDQSKRMPSGKMHLGLSVYDFKLSPKQLLATGLNIKRAIREKTNRSVHLIPNKELQLNTAQVIHNKLTTDNGWELVLIRDGNQTIIAQTLFVQGIDDYTIRDRVRPKRDSRVGMLPPKLAQIIINLAIGPQEFMDISPELSGAICLQPEDNQKMHDQRSKTHILDPFCGTGVILQEAQLMGYQVSGSDIDPRMTDYTLQNMQWLKQRYKIHGTKAKVYTGDATKYTWKESINAVACESYLGRPFTAPPSQNLLEQTANDCNLIIEKFLKNIQPQLKPGTRLCIAIPAWQTKPHTFRQLPLIDHLKDMGYNRFSFKHVRDEDLLYYRDDQIVARKLLVLTKIST